MKSLDNIKRIYWVSGFCCILLVSLNEIIDIRDYLPAFFGSAAEYADSLIEVAALLFVILVGSIGIRQVEKRMKYMEGYTIICSHCKRVKVADHWIDIGVWVRAHSDADISHGLCEDCLREIYPGEADRVIELLKK